MMSDTKKQHFVPQGYLRSWTTDNYLYSIPKISGIIRKQRTKEIAKKNHLYTLPSSLFEHIPTKNRYYQELITEKFIFKVWEDEWGKIRGLLNLHFDLTPVLHSLKSFIINQSIRTPKFLKQNQEKMKRIGVLTDNTDNAVNYAILAIQFLPQYLENCVCEIIHNVDVTNFITSDNPATHWIKDGEVFHHLNGIALTPDLYQNPNYKILCPLNPKYFAVLTPNLGIPINEETKNKVWIGKTTPETVNQFNQMVEYGADKMLFAKNIKDFVY